MALALVLVLFQLPLFVLLLAPLRSLGSSCCPSHLWRGGRDLAGVSLPLPLPPLPLRSFPLRFREGGVVVAAVDNLSLEHATLVITIHPTMATAAALREAAGADEDQEIHTAPTRQGLCAATRRAARPSASPSSLGILHTKRVCHLQGFPTPTGEWFWHSFRFRLGCLWHPAVRCRMRTSSCSF